MKVAILFDAGSEEWSPQDVAAVVANVHEVRDVLRRRGHEVELLPVRYGAIRYTTPATEKPAYLSVSWWGNTPFGPHALELLRLSRIDAVLRFGAESHSHADRKELAQRLHTSISELFQPMVDLEP